MTTVIHGPQGCGKTFHAQALARHFGCARIVDDWDGKTALQPGDLALTNMPACQLSAINDVHVMSFGVAICRAGAAQTVFLSEECQPVALAEAPKTARLDTTTYCGDGYDRAGCRAAIDVTQDLSCYPEARVHGMSQGILAGHDHVKVSFALEGGKVVRMRFAPDELRYLAFYVTATCMGLPGQQFEALIDGIHPPLHQSQSARSADIPSDCGEPAAGESV
ncbi:hypothetical protein [Thauera butanivorans]|uniref:hypothetical protein n=1 Tax=Thauera butanivorans TaxID=86174 RepID=UPI0008393A2F|nr:hypothetical protein [Thauera butanivorans]